MRGCPLLVLCALLPAAAAGDSGGSLGSLPRRAMLDGEGRYWLGWGPRGGRLAFRLEVRTAGYVGFGFSPAGTMAAADIVVGGVAHGRPYLQVSEMGGVWAAWGRWVPAVPSRPPGSGTPGRAPRGSVPGAERSVPAAARCPAPTTPAGALLSLARKEGSWPGELTDKREEGQGREA